MMPICVYIQNKQEKTHSQKGFSHKIKLLFSLYCNVLHYKTRYNKFKIDWFVIQKL